MNRFVLPAVALTALLLAATGASAQNHNSPAGTKTTTSSKCNAAVKPYDYASMACTTITVPWPAIAGQKVSEKFVFRAKAKLTGIDTCFSPGNFGNGKPVCAKPTRKNVVMNKGKTITQTVSYIVPADTKPGLHKTENYTTYKPPTGAPRDYFWNTRRSFVCVVAAKGDSTSLCSVGK